MINFIREENEYLGGNGTSPRSKSFIEPETISETTVVLNLILLVCSIFGIFSTLLLFIGIYKNERCLLFPWLVNMCAGVLIEVFHCGYMFFLEAINFNPIMAVIFTIDFFLLTVHLYAILCVVSQYQYYAFNEGRHDQDYTVRFAAEVETNDESRGVTGTNTVTSQPVMAPSILSNNSNAHHIPSAKSKKVHFVDEEQVEKGVQNQQGGEPTVL